MTGGNGNENLTDPSLTRTHWTSIHRDLGCFMCSYANVEFLGKGPCCVYPGKLSVNESGECNQLRK